MRGTPEVKFTGKEQGIFAERDRKQDHDKAQRKLNNQRKKNQFERNQTRGNLNKTQPSEGKTVKKSIFR